MVTVPGNDIGGATFTIRPKKPGMAPLKVTARSAAAADAVIKELLIRPEGVAREICRQPGAVGWRQPNRGRDHTLQARSRTPAGSTSR